MAGVSLVTTRYVTEIQHCVHILHLPMLISVDTNRRLSYYRFLVMSKCLRSKFLVMQANVEDYKKELAYRLIYHRFNDLNPNRISNWNCTRWSPKFWQCISLQALDLHRFTFVLAIGSGFVFSGSHFLQCFINRKCTGCHTVYTVLFEPFEHCWM